MHLADVSAESDVCMTPCLRAARAGRTVGPRAGCRASRKKSSISELGNDCHTPVRAYARSSRHSSDSDSVSNYNVTRRTSANATSKTQPGSTRLNQAQAFASHFMPCTRTSRGSAFDSTHSLKPAHTSQHNPICSLHLSLPQERITDDTRAVAIVAALRHSSDAQPFTRPS